MSARKTLRTSIRLMEPASGLRQTLLRSTATIFLPAFSPSLGPQVTLPMSLISDLCLALNDYGCDEWVVMKLNVIILRTVPGNGWLYSSRNATGFVPETCGCRWYLGVWKRCSTLLLISKSRLSSVSVKQMTRIFAFTTSHYFHMIYTTMTGFSSCLLSV